MKTRRAESPQHVKYVEAQTSSNWCGRYERVGSSSPIDPDSKSLVVKVTDSYRRVMCSSPSTAENPPCTGAMHLKSAESSNVLPLVWKLGEKDANSGVVPVT
ncbi:hypothetical protein TNCV_4482121 [Trichonephila clavipes]|nr:hypothetical protein TNCV_4482121 [Trichonephila clavipes]